MPEPDIGFHMIMRNSLSARRTLNCANMDNNNPFPGFILGLIGFRIAMQHVFLTVLNLKPFSRPLE